LERLRFNFCSPYLSKDRYRAGGIPPRLSITAATAAFDDGIAGMNTQLSFAHTAKHPSFTNTDPLRTDLSDLGPKQARHLAHVVHLREGTLLLVREGATTQGWRDRFRARLRTCGPWNEIQVQEYFAATYGVNSRAWPISIARIAEVFSPDEQERSIAVARDTPEVRAFLS
jgi:hypothetical protein